MKGTAQITFDALLTPSLLLRRGGGQTFSKLLKRSEIKRYIFYSYGRTALLGGLRILDYKKGSNVLLPSYVVAMAAEPFHELGIETRFYETSLNLQPDIADIKKKIDNQTKGILIANYFGFPQELGEIQDICRKYRLHLIEDNAHGFLSYKDSRLLGTYGDIGFSSIWKMLPVPNGALLFVNNEELVDGKRKIEKFLTPENQLPKISKKETCVYVLNSLLRNLELHYGIKVETMRNIYRHLFPREESDEPDVSQVFQASKVRMSNISLRVTNNTDLDDVFEKRRQNYNFWLSELRDREDVQFVFKELPAGTCPLCFVVIEKETERFAKEMLAKGIHALNWPPLPREVKDNPEYPNTNFLAKHLLLLPVHQSLSQDRLAKIVRG
jgi:dTDP-4-amino-4,6-dideoxygalactose transaminase